MKSAMKHYAIVSVFILALTFAFAGTAAANDEKKNTNNIELKFIGNYENQPVFQLNVTAPVEDEFIITLRDKEGTVLYSDKVKGTTVSKKFMLNIEEMGDGALNVEVRSKKGKTEVYTINRKQSLVEETLVTKVK